MARYKTSGWYNDSYRHSLAAKGVSTRNSFSKRMEPDLSEFEMEKAKYLDKKGKLILFETKAYPDPAEQKMMIKIESTPDRKTRLEMKSDFEKQFGTKYPELDEEDAGYFIEDGKLIKNLTREDLLSSGAYTAEELDEIEAGRLGLAARSALAVKVYQNRKGLWGAYDNEESGPDRFLVTGQNTKRDVMKVLEKKDVDVGDKSPKDKLKEVIAERDQYKKMLEKGEL